LRLHLLSSAVVFYKFDDLEPAPCARAMFTAMDDTAY
jgi:hypothetical protein